MKSFLILMTLLHDSWLVTTPGLANKEVSSSDRWYIYR